MTERPEYILWLKEFKDKPLVKVVTGLRRSGKSTILAMFTDTLRDSGATDDQIISINFEEMDNEDLLDRHRLYKKIVDSKPKDKTLYVFLDEIQHVEEYEKVVDSLYAKSGYDIYMTGSTADLLSSELATRLTGRYVEINVMPFSFRESVSGKEVTLANREQLLMDYLTYGGQSRRKVRPITHSSLIWNG